MNDILKEDIEYIHRNIDFSHMENKTVLVTGATGLIGSSIIISMLEWNRKNVNKVKVIAVVRSIKKAETVFSDYNNDEIEYLESDVCTLNAKEMSVDYIIHGASRTSSKAFINEPVETIMTAIIGTKNMLDFAKMNNCKGFVYLSSMEVYGTPLTDEKIYEDRPSDLNVMEVRTSYPESKRMCENLCVSYASEYNVPAKVVRLTQTFGPGVQYNDGRVFAEFARCIIEGRDIILKTKGETKRNYLYTADAVTAILKVLIDGEIANAYNAANEETYCSIYEMACESAKLSKNGINVVIEENTDISKFGYAPVLKMNLSTDKLKAIGWKPAYALTEMYSRMIKTMKNA